MVVTVILGVLGTGAMLSINNNSKDKRLKKEAQRLHLLLGLAADEALLNLDIVGVHALSNGYAFYRRKTDGEGKVTWEPFDAGGRMRQRDLPENVSLELELEAQTVVLNTQDEQKEEDDPLTPHLWILPDGETMPQYKFRIQLDEGDRAWEVQNDDEGRFSLSSVQF